MITTKKKQVIIKKSQIHEKDTGSPEVQIAILNKQISDLATHLKKHQKDFHSRRGLIKMVAKRRDHLKYLKRKKTGRYEKVAKNLKMKK